VLTNMLPSIEQHVEWVADCIRADLSSAHPARAASHENSKRGLIDSPPYGVFGGFFDTQDPAPKPVSENLYLGLR
jgi:hypothetical protein